MKAEIDPSPCGRSEPEPADDLARLRADRDAALQSADAAIRYTTRLTRLLTILSEPAPLDLLLDRVLSALSELFSSDIVVLLDPAGTGTYVPLAAVGLPEEMIGRPLSDREDGYVATAMRARTPILTVQAGGDPRMDPQLRELGAEVTVWLPVIGAQAARGVLMLCRCRPEPFAHTDADLLAAMAYRIGLALEQAQRSTQLELIVRTNRDIGRYLDESAVCNEAVHRLPEVVGANGAALVLCGPDGMPCCVARFCLEPAWDFAWSGLAASLLADSGSTSVQPYSTADVRAACACRSWQPPGDCSVRALLALPIRREEHARGFLFAMRSSTTSFGPDTVQIGMLYAGQISAALENARLYRAVRDELAERVRAEQELRESEERLKLALMGADLGMWDLNVATGEARFNERWAQMVGYAPDEVEHSVRALEQLIHPEDRSRVFEGLRAHLEGTTPCFETEHRFRTRSGEWIWVLAKGRITHRDAEGRPVRVVGTYLDITEARQLQAERSLLERQKQRISRAESLSRMAGGIAHHFNNLLGAVMGNLELALYDLAQNMSPEGYIDAAMKASHRAAEISQLMLAYLGQTAGKKECLDLAETTREALAFLVFSVPNHIKLRVELPAQGPVILADGIHLKQILTNLVANAIEAIVEREGEITVSVRMMPAGEIQASRIFPSDWEPREGSYVCLSIADTGCGLDAVTQERIFEPFFTTKLTGRGLGLSVVLGLVRASGGAVMVESGIDRGAAFRLLFPPAAPPSPPSRPQPTRVEVEPAGAGLVLLADDEPLIRSIARDQLEWLGYEVISVSDGVEAIEAFRPRKDEFRCVLLDLTMPRMSGWETLAALRALRPDLPVILTSGYDEMQVMQGGHQEQPQAFLHKPYCLADLKAALATTRNASQGS